MNQPSESARRPRFAAIAGQSERTILLGTVLLVSSVSAAVAYILTQWFGVNVVASLLNVPKDCWLDWHMGIGGHCFSDYGMVVNTGLQPNPWLYEMSLPIGNYQPIRTGGPAAAFLPAVLFGFPAHLLGAPQLGLLGYLFALTIAVLAPAIWAARGARGLERVVVFVALGVAAVPAWGAIDRGNAVGFVAAIGLVFLVALRRQRWGLVALMVILATVVKPWFVVLAVALFACRQWRWGGLAIAGVAVTNFAAYLLWPRDFPHTITQSLHNLSGMGISFQDLVSLRNVSFSRGLLLIPDTLEFFATGGKMQDGFLGGPRTVISYGILVLVVVAVLALGRRIPPVMVGIALLTTAALFPPLAYYYYLVIALPIAALVVRDPDAPPGAGIFDRFSAGGDRRRWVGLWISLAAAFSIAQIALPGLIVEEPVFGQFGTRGIIGKIPVAYVTTEIFTPFLWLIAVVAIIVSYTRRPARSAGVHDERPGEGALDGDAHASAGTSALSAEPSPQGEGSPA